MKKETYQEVTSRQSEELSNFEGIFYAFSKSQFSEGIEKVGLTMDEIQKVASLGAGGYILKERVDTFIEMRERHELERKENRKNHKELLEGLMYELGNHEYCVTYDHTEALEALGVKEEDLPEGLLKKAKDAYWTSYEKWYESQAV